MTRLKRDTGESTSSMGFYLASDCVVCNTTCLALFETMTSFNLDRYYINHCNTIPYTSLRRLFRIVLLGFFPLRCSFVGSRF
jgi:hypothetical protein